MRKRQRGKSCALKMMEKADKNMTENMKWGMLGWQGEGIKCGTGGGENNAWRK